MAGTTAAGLAASVRAVWLAVARAGDTYAGCCVELWADWVARWPWLRALLGWLAAVSGWCLARLRSSTRPVGCLIGRVVAWPGWTGLTRWFLVISRGAARGVKWLTRRVWPIARMVAVWLARSGRWLAVRVTRIGREITRAVWRAVLPYLLDVRGWLIHRSWRITGRWLGRMLVRFVRWLPPATARTAVWALIGAGFLCKHVARYCVGYVDYAGIVAEAREKERFTAEHEIRDEWRRVAFRRTGLVLVVIAGIAVGSWYLIAVYGLLAQLGLLTGCVAVFAGIGRALRPPAPRPAVSLATEATSSDRAPFPLADAHTRAEAADCLARALDAEGIELRLTEDPRRTVWGWEIPVVLRAGTPAAIVGKAGDLETHLDLPAGGVLATPDRSRRARVVLRLAETDPFVRVGFAPARDPGSASIKDRARVGGRIDGEPLTVPLLGVHGVVIGSPGSGKSSTLLTLADAVSACRDGVVWDLDPTGDGLRALGGGVGRRERDAAGIEDALADALALAEVRPRMLSGLGMRGGAWEPDAEHPAVVVFVDEYPRLSSKAKQLAVDLLRVGRKSRVTLILAATEATSDALGAAIASSTGLRILHACRHGDVQLVLGPQMLADGWRPDRLHPATADDPGDVGRCYVSTGGHREPLLCKIAPVEPEYIGERGDARATTLPRIDAESWSRARARRHPESASRAGARVDTERADALLTGMHVQEVFGSDERLWTEEILSRLADLHARYREWTADELAAALRRLGISPGQVWQSGRNRRGYHRRAIADAVADQPDGHTDDGEGQS